MIRKFAVAVLALVFGASAPAYGQVTYTPLQLRAILDSGKFPKQGPVSTKTQEADYADCIKVLLGLLDSVKPNYPTRTIVYTSLLRVEKVWTNDAAMTISCSAPDKKIIITTARYE